jgi:predicted DNA-binding transcriptional regulator AlpA
VRSDLLLFLAQKARSEAQQRRLSPPAKSPAPSPAKVPETISPTPPKINEPGLKLVSASEAASLLSMGKSTFWRRVSENKFPQPVKIGRLTRWRVADLMHSIEVLSRKDT